MINFEYLPLNVLYNENLEINFLDYGINIPLLHNRSAKVFDLLKSKFEFLSMTPLSDIIPFTKEDLLLAHNKEYVNDLYLNYSRLEHAFLKSYELIDEQGEYHRYDPCLAKKNFKDAFLNILEQGGLTFLSFKKALNSGFSYHLGGGMHHAMSFGGRGFCLINDIVIGLRKLQNENLIKTAWVIDVDAHKGDGTGEITKCDQSIVTFSIHMSEGWPLDTGTVRDPWFIPNNIERGICEGDENTYLKLLNEALSELKRDHPIPDIAIVINGADPYELDELESSKKLKLSKEQLFNRDKLIFNFLKENKIPQSYLMAGGYGKFSYEIYWQFLNFVGESSS